MAATEGLSRVCTWEDGIRFKKRGWVGSTGLRKDIISDILELGGDKVGKKNDSPKCHIHL